MLYDWYQVIIWHDSRRFNLHNPLTHSRVFVMYKKILLYIVGEMRRMRAKTWMIVTRRGYRNNYMRKKERSNERDYHRAFNINTVDACWFDICKENVFELQFSTMDLIKKKERIWATIFFFPSWWAQTGLQSMRCCCSCNWLCSSWGLIKPKSCVFAWANQICSNHDSMAFFSRWIHKDQAVW